jgi:hypothetical protein
MLDFLDDAGGDEYGASSTVLQKQLQPQFLLPNTNVSAIDK